MKYPAMSRQEFMGSLSKILRVGALSIIGSIEKDLAKDGCRVTDPLIINALGDGVPNNIYILIFLPNMTKTYLLAEKKGLRGFEREETGDSSIEGIVNSLRLPDGSEAEYAEALKAITGVYNQHIQEAAHEEAKDLSSISSLDSYLKIEEKDAMLIVVGKN